MTPRGHTIAYQIWAYANPRGWDCTIAECADAIGVNRLLVGRIVHAKDWSSRFRGVVTYQRGVTGQMWVSVFPNLTKLESTDLRKSVELPE